MPPKPGINTGNPVNDVEIGNILPEGSNVSEGSNPNLSEDPNINVQEGSNPNPEPAPVQNKPFTMRDKELEKELFEPREGKISVQKVFRLSDADFVNVGCTKEELDAIKGWNSELDKLNDLIALKIHSGSEVDKKDIDDKRRIEEQLYNKFVDAAYRHPQKWEYSNSNLPNWLKSTGNTATINHFLHANGNKLSLADKVMLLKHRQASMLAKGIAKEYGKKEPKLQNLQYEVVSNNPKSAALKGVRQESYQSSNNGCWSVSTQLLLKSRGERRIDQTTIRAYRPPYKAGEIRSIANGDDKGRFEETYQQLENDKGNNLMDRGDAFLNFAPGSMLQGLQIDGYSNEVRRLGITRDEYFRRTKNVVTSHILHAIKEEKSPVSFLNGGHYITITGIDEKGIVTYKDSLNTGKDPNKDYKTSLDNLLKRVIYPKASPIRMEWAADIKLSKDYKKLYGIPSEHLRVGDDGEVYMPSSLSTLANIENGYQNKTGTYINRMNESEGPNNEANREQNLKNGGVNMRQIAYLPQKLNIDVLKKKADERTQDEEERLKEMSKSFFKVEPGLNEAMKAKAEDPEFAGLSEKDKVEAAYKSVEAAYNHSISNDQEARGERIYTKASEAGKVPAEPSTGTNDRKYDEFIKKMFQQAKLSNVDLDTKKQYLGLAVAAAMMKAEGTPFNSQKIKEQGIKFCTKTDINYCSFIHFKSIVESNNPVSIATALAQDTVLDVYQVKPDYREGYIREMKQLADNMKTKENRSDKYKAIYDAVQDAAKIDINAENAGELIAHANRKIMDTAKKYADGKEKVRFREAGNDRFNNTLDAISIVAAYAPRTEAIDAIPLVAKIHKARGIGVKSPGRIDLKNFGGERAQKRADELNKANNKKTVEVKTMNK